MDERGSERSAASERLRAAEDELRRERRRTQDELEALEAFERRVRSIDATTGSPALAGSRRTAGVGVGVGMDVGTEAGAGAGPRLSPSAVSDGGLDRVRDAYEATVMDVSHYAEEYDDTYRRSLAEEFSPDLAAALVDGTTFDGRCKRAVLSAIAESKSARESFLSEIDAEREAIERAAETLSEIAEELEELSAVPFAERSFGALDAYRSRIGVLEDKCEAVSDRRQTTVFEQRRTRRLPADATDMAAYFYQELDVEYPVMSAVAYLLEELTGLRLRIERAMASCHA